MIQEIIISVVAAVVTAGVVFLCAKLGQLITAVAKKYNLNIEQATVDSMMASFENALTEAITTTNQTFVNDLKETGDFTKKDMYEAMRMTIANCKKLLASDVLAYLESKYDDIDELIEVMAEAIIGSTKTESADVDMIVSAIVEYLGSLPNDKQYTMSEIADELRKEFDIPE